MAQEPVVWSDVIAAKSLEYMNAVVELRNPALITDPGYNVATNTYTPVGDPVVATGIPARIQPVRMAVDIAGGATSNPGGEVRVRVQIPRTAYSGKIKRGWQVRVLTAERNPELLDYLLVVDSSVNSSWRASATLECSVNVENDPTWSA